MTILIVDDSRMDVVLMSELVKYCDSSSIAFEDASVALSWSSTNRPRLVLVDYTMPRCDGLQFIESFRRMPGKDDVPIVMTSVCSEAHVRQRAFDLGARDFVHKPFDAHDFRRRVCGLLHRAPAAR